MPDGFFFQECKILRQIYEECKILGQIYEDKQDSEHLASLSEKLNEENRQSRILAFTARSCSQREKVKA